MPVVSVTEAEGLGNPAAKTRNKPRKVYETEKRYDYLSYYDPVIGHQIASSLTVTVNRGNTLWDIINHQYGNLSGPEMAEKIEQIKKINKLTNPNKLTVGQDLTLPDPKLELGKKYIEKCRTKHIEPDVRTTFAERQAVLVRKAKPEEMPDQPLIKSVNPELRTITLNQPDTKQSYWVAKTEDDVTFEEGSKQRHVIYKNDLSNLFGHGSGIGDAVGFGIGAVSRSSRDFFSIRPYLTEAGKLKYRLPIGKWGNLNGKFPKGLPVSAKDIKIRYRSINFKGSAALNAAAAIIDTIFDGLNSGDWALATYRGVKSFGEGVAVSYYTAAINTAIIGTATASAASLVAVAAGPPGWVILACGAAAIATTLLVTYTVNLLDDEVFNKKIDPLIWGKERCMMP